MRPIPKFIRDNWMKPSDDDIFAERPWWKGDENAVRQRQDGEWVRSTAYGPYSRDGALSWRGSWKPVNGEYHVGKDDYELTLEAAIRRLDREKPLPHPGLRPGQMWAITFGAGAVCATLQPIVPSSLDLTYPAWRAGRPPIPPDAFVWVFGAFYHPVHGNQPRGCFLTQQAAEILFGLRTPDENDAEGNAIPHDHVPYLLHDPLRPDLAPWAPPEAP